MDSKANISLHKSPDPSSMLNQLYISSSEVYKSKISSSSRKIDSGIRPAQQHDYLSKNKDDSLNSSIRSFQPSTSLSSLDLSRQSMTPPLNKSEDVTISSRIYEKPILEYSASNPAQYFVNAPQVSSSISLYGTKMSTLQDCDYNNSKTCIDLRNNQGAFQDSSLDLSGQSFRDQQRLHIPPNYSSICSNISQKNYSYDNSIHYSLPYSTNQSIYPVASNNPLCNESHSSLSINNFNTASPCNSNSHFSSERVPGIEVNGYSFNNTYNVEQCSSTSLPINLEAKTPDFLNGFEDGNYIYPDYLSSSSFISKEIVEALGPEEVRWFYKTEGDKKWTPFIGYDSIKIEWAYRQFLHKSSTKDGSGSSYYSTEASHCEYIFESGASFTDRPVVCGGLYEVDVSAYKGYSIYWKAEEFTIMRGTWFYEGSWMPVDPIIANQIESEHMIHFQGCTVNNVITEKDTQQGVIHSLTLVEGQIDWFSPIDVFFSHDATPSRLMRSVSKKLGFQKTGYKIHRGYCMDASSDDKPADINHIVFVIHGIGQKMETGRIIKNCTSLRENMKWLKEKHFNGCSFKDQTVEFFPVEWRSSLTLDAGIIDSITPHKIIGLRQMLNASFMDIMYYNSPQYREEIVNGLTGELDRLYTMFTARNPYFEANGGKVSVIAHSLGCVITYDIVTGWSPAPQMSQSFLQALINLTQRNTGAEGEPTLKSFQNALQLVLKQQLEKSSQARLKFKIENFFCLGSPLAVFLGLRQKRTDGSSPTPFFPQGSFRRLFNIFHPADPVAYRIEPLVCPKFSSVAPVTLYAYTSADKTPYDEIPPEPLTAASRPSPKTDTPTTDILDVDAIPSSSALATTPNKGGATAWNLWNFVKQQKKGSDSCSSPPCGSRPVEDVSVSDVLEHRMDFVLREGSMESSYISALTSHTSYWSNMDVAYFLLCTFSPHALQENKTSQKFSLSVPSGPPKSSL